MKALITCPPMLRQMDQLRHVLEDKNIEAHCPEVVQILSEAELIELVPHFDGWIIGDDPATRAVLEAGSRGNLRAAIKWGVGVDNVDFAAARELGIGVAHTPQMFGREVADVAMCYVTSLARHTVAIHEGVRKGEWPKPTGISLAGRTLGLIGFGDIGQNVARRALAADMQVIAYDPAIDLTAVSEGVAHASWPDRLGDCDFLVFTCSLNEKNRHMLNEQTLAMCPDGVRVVNVARGPLIDEGALARALSVGKVHSVALDVFEIEPLPEHSPLRDFSDVVFGSHNGSNTVDAVLRASQLAIELLAAKLNASKYDNDGPLRSAESP